jgi:ABC-2 type transport system ATP-binding protein
MIRARGLVKSFGPVRAVDGVGFEIGRGEIVGFLGPNGAGKSTTMRVLTGYLYPDEGEVTIGGHDVTRDLEGRARIGYLPERTPLYDGMRVDRYLAFVAELRGLRGGARRSAVERVIGDCDLEGWASRRIRTLSKGYRQRVGLAQALVSDPDVLVLDEPTSGLDPVEIVRIRAHIAALADRKTILLSTHVLSEVEEICRRVLILAGGRLVADGSLLDLASDEGECISVVLGVEEAAAPGVEAVLAAIDGVRSARSTSRGAIGRVRYQVEVEERFAVAERLARIVHERGWRLYELSHDVPSLERIFLARTRPPRDGAAEERR